MPRDFASRVDRISTGFPAKRISPLSAREDAGQDLDQRRFAGAVVAEQPQHFAFAEIEAHVLDGVHAAEGLHDVAKLDERRHVSRTLR